VFTIDRTFRPVISYTNDRAALKKAIEAATSGEKSSMENNARLLTAPGAGTAVLYDASEASSSSGGDRFSGMIDHMAAFNSMVDREGFVRISIFSLWGVIAELSRLPGRKSVLLFSEGLILPNGVLMQYQSMISAANRANVAIHTIDARGLTTISDHTQAVRMLTQGTTASVETRAADPVGGSAVRSQMMGFDSALDSIHGNNQFNLTDLAERTGGSAIYNTNDFRRPMRALSEEFNTYYEISYRPRDVVYDGRFRPIAVKVSRAGSAVQARDGYFALPALDGQPVFPYEVPLLHALGKLPAQHDVDFRAGILQFRAPGAAAAQVVLVFDLPLKPIAFTPDDKSKQMRSHLSVLALLKDEAGRVVAKLSRDVPSLHAPERVADFRAGRFIVTSAFALPPGRYTLESVTADQESNRIGVKKAAIVIPAMPAGPAISDIALVRRVDKSEEGATGSNPLAITAGRVIPTLADSAPTGPSQRLSAFLKLYPAADSGTPELAFRLFKEGKLIQGGALPPPPADPNGDIPFLVNLNLDAFAPGEYELRAELKQGEQVARKSLFVTLEDTKPATP
jgi:VWFA-related protein